MIPLVLCCSRNGLCCRHVRPWRVMTDFRARARRNESVECRSDLRAIVLTRQLIRPIRDRMRFPIFPVRYRSLSSRQNDILTRACRIILWVSHYSRCMIRASSTLWVRRWTSGDRRNRLIERGLTHTAAHILYTLPMVSVRMHVCYFWRRITSKLFCHTI